MGAQIVDRGRGPEIAGTRITVYDVMDYWTAGWHCEQIAGLFRLPPDDIEAAIAYIEAHKAEVTAVYQQILARHHQARSAAEFPEKRVRNHQKLQARLAEIRARRQAEDVHASDHGGS